MVNNHQGAKWWFYLFISLRKGYFWGVGSKKISFGGIPNSRNVLFLQIFLKRAAKPSAGNTSAGFPSITWPQILLNLTSLCTKDSHTFSRTLFGILLNLTGLCTKASRNLLRNLLQNPVEPDLALHQSLPHLLPNLPSPEPCWTWPGSAPKPPRPSLEPSPEPSLEPDHALHQSPQTFSGTFSGPSLNLTRRLHQSLPNLRRNLLRNPVEPDLDLHQSLPDLYRNFFRNPVELHPALQSLPNVLGNLRDLLRNLVEPDPAPAPVHTGAILGWRSH